MKKYIKSAIDNSLLISDFLTILSDIYKEKFPYSMCEVWFSNSYSTPSILIICFLGGSRADWANGIDGNDVFKLRFDMDFPNAPKDLAEDDYVPEVCVLHSLEHSIMIEPEDPWYWCDYYRIKFRTVTGDSQKIIDTWRSIVDTIYDATVELYQNKKIHKNALQYFDIEEKLSLK